MGGVIFCHFLKAQKLVVGPSKAYLHGEALSKESHTHSNYALSSHTHSGYAASSHNHSASNITSGTLPLTRGGTGVTSLDALKSLLNVASTTGLYRTTLLEKTLPALSKSTSYTYALSDDVRNYAIVWVSISNFVRSDYATGGSGGGSSSFGIGTSADSGIEFSDIMCWGYSTTYYTKYNFTLFCSPYYISVNSETITNDTDGLACSATTDGFDITNITGLDTFYVENLTTPVKSGTAITIYGMKII